MIKTFIRYKSGINYISYFSLYNNKNEKLKQK